jgi:hypothetical protein
MLIRGMAKNRRSTHFAAAGLAHELAGCRRCLLLDDNLERTGWARCVSLEPCASMPQWGTQTAGASMDDVISKLTAEQALKIVERLTRNGGKIRVAILAEAMNILN